MKSAEIRQAFLQYFESKNHQVVASSSLIPGNDPTLLFTNAGMVQFKDVFLGTDKRDYARATSSQRCVRAGGKHNDLENVGYTARHHTFFEMLGNFSFGDYFKREAIQFAWEFLTQVLRLPPEKLWVTVHVSDDEAADIWLREIGVSAERFSRLDEDNFWQMGDTGPCGPSSEIFYDHGDDVPGGPPGSENDHLDRYIEIWNLVFMQYERQTSGELIALPKPSVDTGMGLERIAAVMQGVHSNYEIDLFRALLDAAAQSTHARDLSDKSLRVIADHIRSCAFLICDGITPSNEGRGYVLRRIIRRAVRHGHKLGQTQPFFFKLVPELVTQMGLAYPELSAAQEHIARVLLAEEEQFAKTLEKGMAVLEDKLRHLKSTTIPGETVFVLYDTYGFPVDLTNDIARERGLELDFEVYEQLMEEQKKKSKDAGTFKLDYTAQLTLPGETTFVGYDRSECAASVTYIVVDGVDQSRVSGDGSDAVLVLDVTPFYAESGGQAGDCGVIETDSARFEVLDCQKLGAQYLHIGKLVSGSINAGDTVRARIVDDLRNSTARNHSATHLLHAALREVLGEHVTQKGSLVDAERLRFDFSHFEALSADQLSAIALRVNQEIQANTDVTTQLCDMDTAKRIGAMALFGEKYGDQVRVLSMGKDGYSIELCGGTHVQRTGDIGLFLIGSESGIASGVRRIEAVTGEHALNAVAHMNATLQQISAQLKAPADALSDKLQAVLTHTKGLEKELAQLKSKLAASSVNSWLDERQEFAGISLLVKRVEGVDAVSLRSMGDTLRNKLGAKSVVLLASAGSDAKISLLVLVGKEASSQIRAGDLVQHVAKQIGGKGGGRADMAQGGGSDIAALPEALSGVESWLKSKLS